jgi:hypothetical protein
MAGRKEGEIVRIRERLRVCGQTWQNTDDLIRLAQHGDKLPALSLMMIAAKMVEALDSIVEQQPKLGRWLARDVFLWPGFISRKRSVRKANEELMDKLQLGKGGIFSAREWQISAPSTQAALKLFIFGQQRATLGLCEPFAVKVKKQWFRENWKAMLDAGVVPEQSDFLRPLGESKAKKKPKYCKNLHPATQNANARDGIRYRVWKAFDGMFASEKMK